MAGRAECLNHRNITSHVIESSDSLSSERGPYMSERDVLDPEGSSTPDTPKFCLQHCRPQNDGAGIWMYPAGFNSILQNSQKVWNV